MNSSAFSKGEENMDLQYNLSNSSFLEFVEKELFASGRESEDVSLISERLLIDGFHINFDVIDGQDLVLNVSSKNSEEKRVLNVHSIILRSKSDFFNCFLSKRWNNERKISIRLPLPRCITYFENIIHYLYGSDLKLSIGNVWIYYCLADYYLIPCLKSLCCRFWLKFLECKNKLADDNTKIEKNSIVNSNLSDIELVNIIKYTENPLKRLAARCLMIRYGNLLQKKRLLNSQLRTLSSDVFASMLTSTNEFFNEEELLKLALYWLTLQSKIKKLSTGVVEDVLSKIRYDLLSKECLKKLSENLSIKYHFARSKVLKICVINACKRKKKFT